MKFWYNPTFLAVTVLVVLSIPALRSLAIPEFFTSHDGQTHTARIAQYTQALKDSQFPPRFAGSFYSGFTSPIFVYIYPLPYFLGSLVHSLRFSFTDTFEILMAFGFVFSGVFSFLWLREIFKSEKAAFLGALFYIWVPYRFLLIYVRGSLSELLAYTFVPLVFFSFTKLAQKKNLFWVSTSGLTFGLLLLSQNLVALIMLPIILGYIFIWAVFVKSSRYFFVSLLALLWGFSISAITYLPAIFERKFVRFDETISLGYSDHFVTLKQLIRSPWGYGFDLPGTLNDQMSLQIGLMHIFAFLLAIFLTSYYFFRKSNRKENEPLLPLILFFIFIVLVTVVLMIKTPPTLFIWQAFKLMVLIDIPWRFLGVIAFAISFLAAFVVYRIRAGIFFLFLAALVLIANRNHLRINQTQLIKDEFFSNYRGTATQYNEFTPRWRQTSSVPVGFDNSAAIEVISGEAILPNIFKNSKEITADINVLSPTAKIQINKFYFPGVSVILDNRELEPFNDLIVIEPDYPHPNKKRDNTGLMLLDLENGNHKLKILYGETPLRKFADFLSLGSVLLAIGFLVKNVKK